MERLGVICLSVVCLGVCVSALEDTVIDISHHNKQVDLERVKAAGVKGILHKATEGATWVDKTYATREAEARNHQLLWGAYHYGTDNDGAAQADHFLNVVGKAGGNKDTLLALDIEVNENNKTNTMSLPNAEAFVNRIKERTGKYPVIYGGNYLKEILAKSGPSVLTKGELWLSEYTSGNPTLPKGWSKYALWQHTDGRQGAEPKTVDGVVGKVDRNKYNNEEYDDLSDFWERNSVEVDGEAEATTKSSGGCGCGCGSSTCGCRHSHA